MMMVGRLFTSVIVFVLIGWCGEAIANVEKKTFFLSVAETRVATGALYRYEVKAGDSTGLKLTLSSSLLPSWLQFDQTSGVISGSTYVVGQYAVRLIASNGTSETDQSFMITVFDKDTRNILCLGNSITNGTDRYNSYRRPLWQMLHKGNFNFDFVGSWDKHHWGGKVPDPDFDLDHDGHSGWTANHILHPPEWDSTRGNVKLWLKSYKVDIVLIELGTNDVFQCRTPEELTRNFGELIDIFRAQNPGVKIVIASVMPLGKKWSPQNLCKTEPYGALIVKMNAAIKAFADLRTTKKSAITLVDISSGMDPDRFMYDDIHPNDQGEMLMAERFYPVISQYLTKLK